MPLQELQLNLDNPAEVERLAEYLNVDAVVIGAVTEYSPYYPPRMGLQVSWYTRDEHRFVPGLPLDDEWEQRYTEEKHFAEQALRNQIRQDREHLRTERQMGRETRLRLVEPVHRNLHGRTGHQRIVQQVTSEQPRDSAERDSIHTAKTQNANERHFHSSRPVIIKPSSTKSRGVRSLREHQRQRREQEPRIPNLSIQNGGGQDSKTT